MPVPAKERNFACMNEVVKLENLSVGYRSHRAERVVMSGLDASLPGGCLTCLIGSNGVGKSTLLKTLSGTLSPIAGRVLVGGEDLRVCSPQQRARLISVVLTARHDDVRLTARETVALGRSPYTDLLGRLSQHDRQIVDESLHLAGADSLADRMLNQLSDGERQKVMVAQALAQTTPVILLDEPTAFLDFPSKISLFSQLRLLAEQQGKCILLSTHDVPLAQEWAHSIWLLDDEGLHITTLKTHSS